MLIEVILTASDTIILCVVGIIQDEVLYCIYIVNDEMLYCTANVVPSFYMF